MWCDDENDQIEAIDYVAVFRRPDTYRYYDAVAWYDVMLWSLQIVLIRGIPCWCSRPIGIFIRRDGETSLAKTGGMKESSSNGTHSQILVRSNFLFIGTLQPSHVPGASDRTFHASRLTLVRWADQSPSLRHYYVIITSSLRHQRNGILTSQCLWLCFGVPISQNW